MTLRLKMDVELVEGPLGPFEEGCAFRDCVLEVVGRAKAFGTYGTTAERVLLYDFPVCPTHNNFLEAGNLPAYFERSIDRPSVVVW